MSKFDYEHAADKFIDRVVYAPWMPYAAACTNQSTVSSLYGSNDTRDGHPVTHIPQEDLHCNLD